MSTGREGRDFDALLREAGARWRSQQVFGEVSASPDRIENAHRKGGSVGDPALGAVGLLLTAAVVLAVLDVPLGLRLGAEGGDNIGAVATPGGDPSLPVTTTAASLGPADLEAAQLAVIEAVNADPVNFGVPSIDNDGVLVIPYVGANAGRAAVEETISPGVAVRWEKVEHTRSELQRIAGEITDLNLNGVFAISSGTSRNLVIVYVGPGGSVSEVSQILAEYGDAVRVEFSSDIPVVLPAQPTAAP